MPDARDDQRTMSATLDAVYESLEGSEALQDYSARHGVKSASVLTVYTDETAGLIAQHLAPHIEGKTIVEIGGGIGLLAFHLGMIAKRVYCIEANPAWSWVFAGVLLKHKPKNVSYLFGTASEFEGLIQADVALFCTHSGVAAMKAEAAKFAPKVIDVYGELIAENPCMYDTTARLLRPIA